MGLPLLFAQITEAAPSFQASTQPWPGVEVAPVDPAVMAGAPLTAIAGAVAPPPQPDALHQIMSFVNGLDKQSWEYMALQIILHVGLAMIVLTTAWTISSWGSSLVRSALDRIRFDETLSIFLSKLVRWSILLLAGLTCLSYFGVQTASFTALIGAAGLAIGLAFQGTLSNFAAGAMLLIFRPYKVGDEVNVAGYTGTVREVELFTTVIDTPDNRRIIVPNSSIFGAVIENVTHHPVRRFSVNVGTAYAADIDETRRVLDRAVRSVVQIVPTPSPSVTLVDLGASSVNWTVHAWAKRETYGEAKQAVIRAVKIELDESGIGIPFPQLDLHLDPPEAETARRAA